MENFLNDIVDFFDIDLMKVYVGLVIYSSIVLIIFKIDQLYLVDILKDFINELI